MSTPKSAPSRATHKAPPVSRYHRRRTDFLVVHAAATTPSMDIGAAEIAKWHRARGFRAIGYHFVIRRDGRIETGRAMEHRGAHAKGVNDRSIGVCLVGGLSERGYRPEANFTDAQMTSLSALLDALEIRYPGAEILGHCDLPRVRKACPCFDVRAWRAAEQAPPEPEEEEDEEAQAGFSFEPLLDWAFGREGAA